MAAAENTEKVPFMENEVGKDSVCMVFLRLMGETPALSGRCFPMGIRRARMYGSDD
jgi:hypothetical protein